MEVIFKQLQVSMQAFGGTFYCAKNYGNGVIHKKSFRSKRELILNWFRAGETLSSGSVEGFNSKVKVFERHEQRRTLRQQD